METPLSSSVLHRPEEFPPGGDWLRAARGGSRDALGDLLELYRRDLLVLAQRLLDPVLQAKSGASDLVQETFLRAQRGFAEFQGETPSELLGWLRSILLNQAANFVRHYRATDKRQVSRELPLARDDVTASAQEQAPLPGDIAAQRERAALLERALEKLPDHYLQVILLRHRENQSFEAIGQTLGRSPEAARKLWERGVAQLRNYLPVNDEP